MSGESRLAAGLFVRLLRAFIWSSPANGWRCPGRIFWFAVALPSARDCVAWLPLASHADVPCLVFVSYACVPFFPDDCLPHPPVA